MTPVELQLKRIIYNVCEGTGIDFSEITGESRKNEKSYARFILAKRLHTYGLTTPQIAEVMNKTNATIHYQLSQYDNLIQTCEMFKDMVFGVEIMESLPADLTMLK